ncbi:MAG TPA: beta-Ala-His dipeptidase [Anaerovoracaceae bacterium]|nr:beta-Ala-His dipeptidase [Anaerovoracaceae bacterium]
MEYILDITKPHQKFFEEISRIPRQSFREQDVSDYIVTFAKDRGLWLDQDKIGNVIIKKGGTSGFENSGPVMLQAHLDMVCEKEPEISFDFSTESIKLIEENGWVKAQGTTLGADDGAGVALILAILDHQTMVHPPLECVFTVQEEDGMGGARHLDYTKLSSKMLVALDGLEEGTTIVSTTGIHCGYITKDCSMVPNDKGVFSLKVSGLRGGHAALNIGKGQGNAIQITARILSEICSRYPVQLVSITGGTILNGIPQENEARFTLFENVEQSEVEIEDLRHIVQKTAREILEDLKDNDPGLTAVLCSGGEAAYALTKTSSDEVLRLICMIPIGVDKWDKNAPDFPIASRNLGTISMDGSRIKIGYSCRGISNTQISDMVGQTVLIAEKHNAVYQEAFHYSGYTVEEDSPLINVWSDVFKEETGKDLIRRQIHSGTDAGTIADNMGGMDIIVLMPNTLDVHTPRERMELASFDRTYEYLCKILERLSVKYPIDIP